jgi:hypothetical protein
MFELFQRSARMFIETVLSSILYTSPYGCPLLGFPSGKEAGFRRKSRGFVR